MIILGEGQRDHKAGRGVEEGNIQCHSSSADHFETNHIFLIRQLEKILIVEQYRLHFIDNYYS